MPTTARLNTPTADAATLPPFITDPPPKRRRRPYVRVPIEGHPKVRKVAPGVVSVSLFGGRAAGRSMLVDADVWADVSERLTPHWVVNTNGTGREYVRSGANVLASVARQPGDSPTATLARIISGATRRQVVCYRNDNSLDLRRVNLTIGSRAPGRPRSVANG